MIKVMKKNKSGVLGRKNKELMTRRAQLMLRLASQVVLEVDDFDNKNEDYKDVSKTYKMYSRIYTLDENIVASLNPDNFDTDESSGTDEDIPK